MNRQLLIVGIDPGTTSGYALLDLDGRLLETGSSKEYDFNLLVKKITDKGRVLLVGTDKKHTPSFVQKFAVKTGGKLAVPKEDMLVIEKNKIAVEKTRNEHERDALASAKFAYKDNKIILEKIKHYISKHNKQAIGNELTTKVVLEGISITKAVQEIERKEEVASVQPKIEEKQFKHEDYLSLREKYLHLKKENEILVKQQRNLREIIKNLTAQTKKLHRRKRTTRDDKIRQKEKSISFLERQIRDTKTQVSQSKLENNLLESFLTAKNDIIAKKFRNLGLVRGIEEGDILLVDDANNYSEKTVREIEGKVSIIITKKPVSAKAKEHLPFIILNAGKLRMSESTKFALVNKQDFAREKMKSNLLSEIVANYRKERHAT